MAKPSDGASGWSKQVVQVRLVSDGVEFMVMSLGIEGVGRNSHPPRVCIKRPGCVFLFIDLSERETPKGLTSGADTPLYEMTSEGETPRWVDVKRGYPLHFHGMT